MKSLRCFQAGDSPRTAFEGQRTLFYGPSILRAVDFRRVRVLLQSPAEE